MLLKLIITFTPFHITDLPYFLSYPGPDNPSIATGQFSLFPNLKAPHLCYFVFVLF